MSWLQQCKERATEKDLGTHGHQYIYFEKKEVPMEENGLRMYRLKLKLMQQDVADRVGIPLLSYQRYESGSRSPRIKTAMRIAKALNTNVYEIWKDF